MKQVAEEHDHDEQEHHQPEVAAAPEIPNNEIGTTTKNIAVDIPTTPKNATVYDASAQALEDVPLSADTDRAVENMPMIESLMGSHEVDAPASPVHATDQKSSAQRRELGDSEPVRKHDTSDNDPVDINSSSTCEGSERTVSLTTVKEEKIDVIAEKDASDGCALTRDRQDSLASLSTDTDSLWDSSEGTLKSGTLPDKVETDPPPVQNVQKKDIVIEAVDIGVSPQQAQFVVLESVTEEDEDTVNGDGAETKNGDSESAKVRARDIVADDEAAPAAPLNGKQVVINPHVSTAIPTKTTDATTTTTPSATTETLADTASVRTVMTQTKMKLKPQLKRDAKPLALTLRIVVALPLVVMVLYCTYRFTHLPIPNRSSP